MFVVVKETGEYSSMDYRVLAVCATLDDAVKYQGIQEYKASLLDKIAALRLERRDVPRFEIMEVPDILPESMDSLEVELNKLDELYKHDLDAAKEWREAYDRDREAAVIQRKKEDTERQRAVVYGFMEWWNAGTTGDAFFHEKKLARFREIKKDFQAYLLTTGDEVVLAWMRENNVSMGHT